MKLCFSSDIVALKDMIDHRSYIQNLKELSHGILNYFGHIQNYLNGRKHENNSLIR